MCSSGLFSLQTQSQERERGKDGNRDEKIRVASTIVTTTMGSHWTRKRRGYEHAMKTCFGERFSVSLTNLQENHRHDQKQELGLSCHIPAPGVAPREVGGRGAAATFRGCHRVSSPAPTFHGCCSLPPSKSPSPSPEKDTPPLSYTVRFWET